MAHGQENEKHPRVFLSYAWESEEYRLWVRRLADSLRRDGVDVRLDAWHRADGQDFVAFMNHEAREAQRILVLGSPQYRDKVHAHEAGAMPSGAGWEAGLLAAYVFRGQRGKLVFAIGSGTPAKALPDAYTTQPAYDLIGADAQKQYEDLLRDLLGRRPQAPHIGTPPLIPDDEPRPLFVRPDPKPPPAKGNVEDRAVELDKPFKLELLNTYLRRLRDSLRQEENPLDAALFVESDYKLYNSLGFSSQQRQFHSIVSLLSREERAVIITGPPGSGLTTTLRHVTLRARPKTAPWDC